MTETRQKAKGGAAKPFTPNSTMPESAPENCSGCKHWREREDGLGLCVADPPSHVLRVTRLGPLCCHTVTAADTVACSRAEPK